MTASLDTPNRPAPAHPVRLHPSALLAAGLITFLLATTVLPGAVPGRPGSAYAAAGLLGALLFLSSVAAHEMAHAVVARRNGVTVRSVVIWALGGATELDGEPPGAGAAFRIAAVGPLTSAVLGGAMIGSAFLSSGLTAAVLGWLGITNLLLAGFNLLPGAPLDGGRIVSSAVWARTGDLRRGRLAAARAGAVVGLVVMALGVAQALLGSLVGGLWLVLIGMFLRGSAKVESVQASSSAALRERSVRDVMTPADAQAGWLSVAAFLEKVATPSRDTVWPVAAFDGSPAGVVVLAKLVAVPEPDREDRRVSSLAVPMSALLVLAPDDPAERLLGAPLAVVLDEGRVVGVVTPVDVARAVSMRPKQKVGAR